MLIEIERYKDFKNLKDLHKAAQNLISNTDLKNLEEYFLNRPNDNYENETWFLVTYKNGKRQFKSNINDLEDVEIDKNQPDVESSWFYVNLYDATWHEDTKFDPLIETIFHDIIYKLKKFNGVTVAGIHFASPRSIISQHKDYEESENCNNVVLVLESADAKFKISNTEYTLNSNQTFIFDASLDHSIENLTDKYFVTLTMRIDKDFIK
jgi:hypothetical protein